MLVADRKPIIEISYEISQLIISQSEVLLHCLQHYVNDDLKGICKCDVGQLCVQTSWARDDGG